MGKSLTATMMGILVGQGVYTFDQPAPIPEWQQPGDPRAGNQNSGHPAYVQRATLPAPQDPDYDSTRGYPDHLCLYRRINSFTWTAERPQQWPPNTVGRYHNLIPSSPTTSRLGVEKQGGNYHAFPQKALFDKIGVRTMIMKALIRYGKSFLTQG